MLVKSEINEMVGEVIREGSNFYEVNWPDGRTYTVKKSDSYIVRECPCCFGTGYTRNREESS